MTELKQDIHCSYCGTLFTVETHPKKCAQCGNTAWKNPIPVVVALIPVFDSKENKLGCLVVKRSIQPKLGEWALPGGYMDDHETWQGATAREVREEVGLDTHPDAWYLLEVVTAPTTGNLLVVAGHTMALKREALVFVPNSEVSEVDVLFEPVDLAFPTHTEMLRNFFSEYRG